MLANIIMKLFPAQCNKTSPCLMLVNWLTISPPKLVRTILLYPCYIQVLPNNINSQRLPIQASTADTTCAAVNQLLEGWNCSQITKMLVDSEKPLESYTIVFNLSQAELKAVWKKKGHS